MQLRGPLHYNMLLQSRKHVLAVVLMATPTECMAKLDLDPSAGPSAPCESSANQMEQEEPVLQPVYPWLRIAPRSHRDKDKG